MYSDREIAAIVSTLRRFPELNGCVIGYVGDNECRVVADGDPRSPLSPCVAVVIEEVNVDPGEAAQLSDLSQSPSGTQNLPDIVTNQSRIAPELVGAGISCGLTIASAFGVLAGAAAEVPTVGASTFLVVVAWTGLATGGIQCLNGLVRVGTVFARPKDNTLQRWDSNLSYAMAILIVDGIGVAGGVASLPFLVRNLWSVLVRQRVFVARGLSLESLRAMNRVARMRAISEVFEEAAKTPAGRAELVSAARAAEIGAPSMQRAAGISVRHAQLLKKVISEQTVRRISSSLRDVLASIGGVGASATPAALAGSASGSVNYLVNLIDAGGPSR